MSNYATLDAHSRNCSACIKQREGAGGGGGPESRKHSHTGHTLERKKTSLPGDKRKISGSNTSLIRRSNSCLSSCSMTSSYTADTVDCSTYLTPTQRKNQEIKKIRLELERANNLLLSKDKEITVLKKEVAALKASQNPSSLNDSWIAETESAADSGNCEETVWDTEPEPELVTMVTNNKMDNIDFELMESALREEEEYRHKLEEDNQELNDQIADLREEILKMKETHNSELYKLKNCHSEDVIDAKKESNQKVEELIIELAESSMRCARQQDAIEQRQLKIDELLKEVSTNKDTISKLEDLIHENKTKEHRPTENVRQDAYLNKTKHLVDISSQTEPTNRKILVDSNTQTDEQFVKLHDNHLSDNNKTEMQLDSSQNQSESTCDNKIHYTYQFLRRSIYYYITDKDNRAYHLRSIQRLLEFSDAELNNIHNSRPAPVQPVKRY